MRGKRNRRSGVILAAEWETECGVKWRAEWRVKWGAEWGVEWRAE